VSAAKRTLLLAISLLALVAVFIVGAAGGAPPGKDHEAPSAPSNLRVSVATQTLVRVAWDASSDNVAVAGYYVFGDRGKATLDTGLDKPEYTLSGLSCGQSSTLTIVAFDDAQNRSDKSTLTVSSAPCTDTLPPTTPSGFTQVATSDNAVVVAWNPSVDNVGVVGYDVYRNLQRIANPSEPTATLSGLACGSSYDYTVDAVDAAGNHSLFARTYVQTSACASSSPPPPPTPPPPSTDTQAPSTPGGLAASNITQNGLTLSWNPSTDNVQVTGYDLYRNGTKLTSVTSTSAGQSGLSCGISYTFAVVARDAAGNSSPSAQLTAATSACSASSSGDTTPPSAPTGLAASNTTQTGLALNWSAATDNLGVTAYDVYRNGTKVTSVTSTSAGQNGLSCGTSYTFAVVARDAAGNSSPSAQLTAATSACSASSSSTDTTPPSAPTGLNIVGATGSSVALAWSASSDNVGVVGYRVYVNGSFASSTAQRGITVATLNCGSAYTFEVAAFDAEGNTSNRASVIGSTLACPDTQAPSAPTGVVASSRTATSIALIWNASTDNVGVVGYGLYRAYTATSSSSSTTGIFSGLTCNTNYTLAVDAYDAAGNRSNLTTVMVSTTACPDTQAPSTPSGLAASNVTQSGLTLTWNPSADNVAVTSYDVFRNGQKTATVTGTSSSQTGLACATSYTFSVAARDAAGNTSPQAQTSASTAACSTAAPEPTAASLYSADFETGDFSQVRSQQESTPDRITLTTSNPLQGTYSALVKDGPSDSNIAGSQTSLRAEMEFGTISQGFFGGGSLEGKDTWITWNEKLDSNWEIGQTWAVITQFLGATGSGWPMFAIQANGPAPGKLYAVVRGGPVSETAQAAVIADPLPLGQTLSFKVYHHWSTGSGGVVKVWLNGALKATINGPNLFIGYESTPYQKGGIYRSSSGITRDSQLWIDNVRWSKSDPG